MYNNGNSVKYDLMVAPGVDPARIRVRYQGQDGVELRDVDLHAITMLGDVIEKSPVAYQFIEGKKVLVKCEFFLDGNTVSFVFPDGYDDCH